MGGHGIRNRPPQRRMTDAITPDTPPLRGMVTVLLLIGAVLFVWAVIAQLILAH